MSFGCMALCRLHGKGKPEYCQQYPQIGDPIPAECTYYFEEGVRKGECRPDVCKEHTCCAIPRKGGEPLGVGLSAEEGGLPCKHIEWEHASEPQEKVASEDEDSIHDHLRSRSFDALSGGNNV